MVRVYRAGLLGSTLPLSVPRAWRGWRAAHRRAAVRDAACGSASAGPRAVAATRTSPSLGRSRFGGFPLQTR